MLIEKDKTILKTIIEVYVGEGSPVSSRAVQQAGGYSMSTATIRNRMADLERAGYLTKPHTSAGRIPTDDGYRAYVDDLDPGLTMWDGIGQQWRGALREDRIDIGEIMSQASHILGDLSKNLAVVYGSVVQESTVARIKLVKLEGPRLLVVVNLDPRYERATTLSLEREFSVEAIAGAEALINRIVADKTLGEAKTLLETAVRDNVTGEGIITREISIRRESIFSEPPAVELYFEERGHLLEQPELSDPKNLQLILRLLHDKDYLTAILAKRETDGTQVTIGAENEEEALQPFSLITSGYRMGVSSGVLGIIGPTRMRYDLALSLVASIARELRAIGEEFF